MIINYNLYNSWLFYILLFCLFGKFLLTMRPQKYVFDHCNWSLESGPNWKQKMLTNSLQKKDFCVNRPESVIFSTEMWSLQTRTYWKVGTPWDWNFKILKCKNKMYQRIDTYCWIQRKSVWARHLRVSEKFYLALLENTMDYVVLSYH